MKTHTNNIAWRLARYSSVLVAFMTMGVVGCEYYTEAPVPNGIIVKSPERGDDPATQPEGSTEDVVPTDPKETVRPSVPPPADPSLTGPNLINMNPIALNPVTRNFGLVGGGDDATETTPTPEVAPSPQEVPSEAPLTDGGTPSPGGSDQQSSGVKSLPVDCTPVTYDDGRVAVPLVVTAYEHKTSGGGKARFVMTTEIPIELNDKITTLLIEKGPNYDTGDKVMVYEHDMKGNSLSLGPGYYDLNDPNTSLNDKISSLEIVRSATLPKCVKPINNDSLTWNKPIHLIVPVYEDTGLTGRKQQFIDDIHHLGTWFENDEISSLKVLKGPDYQEGDYAVLYANPGGKGQEMWLGLEGGNDLISETVPFYINDKASSIRFFDTDGNHIYSDEE